MTQIPREILNRVRAESHPGTGNIEPAHHLPRHRKTIPTADTREHEDTTTEALEIEQRESSPQASRRVKAFFDAAKRGVIGRLGYDSPET